MVIKSNGPKSGDWNANEWEIAVVLTLVDEEELEISF